MNTIPHVARLRLPPDTATEAFWGPHPETHANGQPRERWSLRWRYDPATPELMPRPVAGPVCSIGLNPSGAGTHHGDMTLNTEWSLYRRWGVLELLKLNAFATIATYPPGLLEDSGDPSYPDYVIAQATAVHQAGGLVLATWGGPYGGALQKLVAARCAQLVDGLLAARVPLHVLGQTKGGCPRHIRGIGRNATPLPWRAP